MKIVHVYGTASQMGLQYGEEARNDIRLQLELSNPHIGFCTNGRYVERAVLMLKKVFPELLEELVAVSKGADVPFEKLLAINFIDTFDELVERCTPMVLHSASDGLLVAKNNDALPQEKNPFILLFRHPNKGIPTASVTYAGFLSGLDCLNAEGLANMHGSVGSIYNKSGLRIDIRLAMMGLMTNCSKIDDLLAKLNELPLTGKGYSIALGDATEHSLFVDAALPLLATRNKDKTFDFSTNLYRACGLENADRRPPEKKAFCLERTKFLEDQKAPQNELELRKLLSNHSVPSAPCRHGGPSHSITTWSVIAKVKERKFLLSDGFPCKTQYKEYTF